MKRERHAGRLPASATSRPAGSSARAGLAALWLAAGPALAGVVFREAETVQGEPPGGELRQVRQVFAEGDNCKVVLEDASDPVIPVGAYVLASSTDAFLVDPAERSIAPLDPTAMVPVGAAADGPSRARILDVKLEPVFEADAPPILGLPVRHLVLDLRYLEEGGAEAPTRWRERHELWVTPWAEGEALPAAWQKLRIAEDGGLGAERAEIRDALEQIHRRGAVLRQAIERRSTTGEGPQARVSVERVLREVTSFRREALSAGVFDKPAGYAQTEVLAPVPEPEAAPERAEPPGSGTQSAAAPGRPSPGE